MLGMNEIRYCLEVFIWSLVVSTIDKGESRRFAHVSLGPFGYSLAQGNADHFILLSWKYFSGCQSIIVIILRLLSTAVVFLFRKLNI